MKRIVSLMVFLAVIALPSISFAGEKTGVYVAPKLITGWTQMKNTKGIDEDGDTFFKMNNTKGTIGGGLALGYDFYRQFQVPVRMEIEYAAFSAVKGKKNKNIAFKEGSDNYTGTESMSTTVQAQTLFLNTYYDFHNSTKITPYVNAGFGMAFLKAKGKGAATVYQNGGATPDPDESGSDKFGSKNNTNFAWNVGAGVAYDITETLSLDLGYRFAALGSAKTKKDDGEFAKIKHVNMHQVALGLRLTF